MNFCWLFNIGIEENWSIDRFKVKDQEEDHIVQHMEEIMMLMAGKDDILLLRRRPNDRFICQMRSYGFEVPEIICPEKEDATKTITQLALEDKKVVQRLKKLSQEKSTYLLPYGVTENEEVLAKACDMKIMGSDSAVARASNSKLYAKELVKRLHLSSPDGKVCVNFDEIREEWHHLRKQFRRIVIKRPYGASGRGLYLVEDFEKLEKVLYILKRSGGLEEKWIVEGWYEDKKDLNTQMCICGDGKIMILSVKEQILEETVYKGSIFPVELSADIKKQYLTSLEKAGRELHRDGIRGIVGIDSIVTKKEIFPIIEINVRFTLSTYLSMLPSQFSDRYFCSMYYRIFLSEKWNYSEITKKLVRAGLAFDTKTREGIFCYNHACVDRDILGKAGRLFVILMAKERKDLQKLRLKLEQLLEEAVY
ncbi:MAG: ATP-grasp domain-containing protein [Lachnospiraceae bacterium]|nr:ATP-grasp domain-containing protein [Lachnospiraceae bacterium]